MTTPKPSLNQLKAAIAMPHAPLFNGRHATASELIRFNRQWRDLMRLRKLKPALFGSVLELLGLIEIEGTIRAGEPWETFTTTPDETEGRASVAAPGLRIAQLKAAITTPGAPLFGGRIAKSSELLRFNRQWRKLLSMRRTDPHGAAWVFAELGLIVTTSRQSVFVRQSAAEKPEEEQVAAMMTMINQK